MKEQNEEDAALVDSYFLPGGLFADEIADESNNDCNHRYSKSNNINSQSEINLISGDNNIHRQTQNRSPLNASTRCPIPRNPWTQTSVSRDSGEQLTVSSITKTEACSLHSTMLSINQGQKSNLMTGNSIDGLCDQSRRRQDEHSLFRNMEEVVFPKDNSSNNISRIKQCKKIIRPPPGFQEGSTTLSDAFATAISYQIVSNQNPKEPMKFPPMHSSTVEIGRAHV